MASSIQPLLGEEDKAGVFGVIAVLFNEGGHLPDHAAEAGHRALNSAVENAINNLLRTLSPSHTAITQEDIAGIIGNVSQQVHDAILNDLSFWEKLWAATEADFEIGHQTWNWDQDIVPGPNGLLVLSTGENWGSPLWANFGWSISGTMSITDTCPADVLASVFSGFLDGGISQLVLPAWYDAMQTFRSDGGFTSQPGLSVWWDLVVRHLPYFAALTSNHDEFREAVARILDDLPLMLADPDSPIRPETKIQITVSTAKELEKVLNVLNNSES